MSSLKYGQILNLDAIRCLMADRKVSKVARRIGLDPNTIYRILHGTAKPSYETLKALTEYLTTPPEQILERYLERYKEQSNWDI